MAESNEQELADILVAAARSTSALVNSERFTRLVMSELKMVGKPMLEYLESSDKASVFVPIDTLVDSKWMGGGFLGLQDRGVLVWWTGVRRISHFHRVIPYDEVRAVTDAGVEPASWRQPERVKLLVECDPPVTLRVFRVDGGASVPFILESALLGAVSASSEATT